MADDDPTPEVEQSGGSESSEVKAEETEGVGSPSLDPLSRGQWLVGITAALVLLAVLIWTFGALPQSGLGIGGLALLFFASVFVLWYVFRRHPSGKEVGTGLFVAAAVTAALAAVLAIPRIADKANTPPGDLPTPSTVKSASTGSETPILSPSPDESTPSSTPSPSPTATSSKTDVKTSRASMIKAQETFRPGVPGFKIAVAYVGFGAVEMALYVDGEACSTGFDYLDIGQSIVTTDRPEGGTSYKNWYRVEIDKIDDARDQISITWSVGTGTAPNGSITCGVDK
jgi:hypothetical protein